MVSEKLTRWGREVIQKADRRNRRYDALSARMFKSPAIRKQLDLMEKGTPKPDYYRNLEAKMLAAIIAFEISSNKKNSCGRLSALGWRRSVTTFSFSPNTSASIRTTGLKGSARSGRISFSKTLTRMPSSFAGRAEKSARVAKLAPYSCRCGCSLDQSATYSGSGKPANSHRCLLARPRRRHHRESLPTLRKIAEHSRGLIALERTFRTLPGLTLPPPCAILTEGTIDWIPN